MIDNSKVLRKKSRFKQGTETDGVVALDLAAFWGEKTGHSVYQLLGGQRKQKSVLFS